MVIRNWISLDANTWSVMSTRFDASWLENQVPALASKWMFHTSIALFFSSSSFSKDFSLIYYSSLLVEKNIYTISQNTFMNTDSWGLPTYVRFSRILPKKNERKISLQVNYRFADIYRALISTTLQIIVEV